MVQKQKPSKHRQTEHPLLGSDTERKTKKLTLSETEVQYKALFDKAPIMYVVTKYTDEEPVLVDCNQIFLDTLGYNRQELIGHSIKTFYAPESHQALQANMDAMATLPPHVAIEDKRYLLAKDGRHIPTLFRLILEWDEKGRIIGSQAMYVDLTLYEEAQKQAYKYASHLEVMYRASVELSRSLNVEDVFERLLENLHALVPYDGAHVMLLDDYIAAIKDQEAYYPEWKSPRRGRIQLYRPDSNPILKSIYEQKQTVIIGDTLQSPDWETVTGSEQVRNWMGVPLVVKDEVIGLFGMNKHEPHFFTSDHMRLAESLAAHAAVSIANATLYSQVQHYARDLEQRVTQRTADLLEANNLLHREINERKYVEQMLRTRTEQLHVLRNVGLQIAEQLDLSRLLDFVLEQAMTLLHVDSGLIALVAQAEGQEKLIVVAKNQSEEVDIGDAIAPGAGVTGLVWIHKQTYFNNHYQQWSGRYNKSTSYRSALATPIIWREQMMGVLTVLSTTEDYFDNDAAELSTLFAVQTAVAIQNARLHDTVQQNRIYLEEEVLARTQELTVANQRLRELDRLRSKLIYDISHELRTPVSTLGLYLDLLARKPEKRERYTQVLKEQMQRLSTLVQDIVDVAELHSREEQATFEPLNLTELIQRSVESHQPKAEEKGLKLYAKLADDLPLINGDSRQLEDLFKLLLLNSLAYTVKGHIVIETEYAADEIIVRLIDTGIGIAEEDIPYIFDPLFRGSTTGQSNIPGIGLGLTTAQEIVRIHKGEIVVNSMIDEGTTFTIYLPVLPQ